MIDTKNTDSHLSGPAPYDGIVAPEVGYVNPLVTVRMDEVVAECVEFLWPGRIPLGKLSILAGQQGLGKSLLALDMAARITTGTPWPDLPGVEQTVSNVVVLAAEDGLEDTIKPRLVAAGADCQRIIAVKGVRRPQEDGAAPFDIARDTRHLHKTLSQIGGVRLVVIDPLSAYLGGAVDAHRDNEVRAVLGHLADLAEQHRVAVLALMHLRKAVADNALDRVMGSVAFTAVPRAVWTLARDKDDKDRRLFMSAKMNLTRAAESLAFYVVSPGRIEWAGTVDADADEVLGADDGRKNAPAREIVEQWLRNYMISVGRSATANDVKAAAEKLDHAWRTVQRAKKSLGIVAAKGDSMDSPWQWTLPADDGGDIA